MSERNLLKQKAIRAALLVALLFAVAGVVAGIGIGRVKSENAALEDENAALEARIAEITRSAGDHVAEIEVLVAECSRIRIDRDEQRNRADSAEARLADMGPRLARALADLQRISTECDEHLEARIRLTRRVEDLLSHMAESGRED